MLGRRHGDDAEEQAADVVPEQPTRRGRTRRRGAPTDGTDDDWTPEGDPAYDSPVAVEPDPSVGRRKRGRSASAASDAVAAAKTVTCVPQGLWRP